MGSFRNFWQVSSCLDKGIVGHMSVNVPEDIEFQQVSKTPAALATLG